ncbi:MAG TPA: hypothetical protein VGK73_08850 [Polyangiaceae bacterium]
MSTESAFAPTTRIGLLTVVSVDGDKCACLCDCGASVVRSIQVLRRAKGLANKSSCRKCARLSRRRGHLLGVVA